jgi:hypothetical protein
MLASQSKELYAGRMVAHLDSPGELKPTLCDLYRLPVRNSDAARMFAFNLSTCKDHEFVRANYSSDSIMELEEALRIAASESSARDIEWQMRQAAWLKE